MKTIKPGSAILQAERADLKNIPVKKKKSGSGRYLFFFAAVLILAGGASWFLLSNSRVEELRNLGGMTERYFWINKLFAERSYAGEKLEGITKTYYGDGTVKAEIEFLNDKQHGVTKQYSKKGILQSETLYEQGEKMSKKIFDETGNVVSDRKFK